MLVSVGDISNNMFTQLLVEDVMKAIHLKSFDYRVMNLLLYKLRDEKVKLINKK